MSGRAWLSARFCLGPDQCVPLRVQPVRRQRDGAPRRGRALHHPGMLVLEQFVNRTYLALLIDQYGDAVGDRDERIEIVRHHEYGEAEAFL